MPAKRKTARKPASKARKTTAKKTTARRKTTAKKPAAKRATARKTTAKRATPKKTTAKRKTTARKPAASSSKRVIAIRNAFSKTQILSTIADNTGLTKNDVKAVIEQIEMLIEAHVKKGGAGEFTLPGLLKIKVVRKPAKPARRGINPFTGEETTFKAKPAHNVVKIKPLKKLKDKAA